MCLLESRSFRRTSTEDSKTWFLSLSFMYFYAELVFSTACRMHAAKKFWRPRPTPLSLILENGICPFGDVWRFDLPSFYRSEELPVQCVWKVLHPESPRSVPHGDSHADQEHQVWPLWQDVQQETGSQAAHVLALAVRDAYIFMSCLIVYLSLVGVASPAFYRYRISLTSCVCLLFLAGGFFFLQRPSDHLPEVRQAVPQNRSLKKAPELPRREKGLHLWKMQQGLPYEIPSDTPPENLQRPKDRQRGRSRRRRRGGRRGRGRRTRRRTGKRFNRTRREKSVRYWHGGLFLREDSLTAHCDFAICLA